MQVGLYVRAGGACKKQRRHVLGQFKIPAVRDGGLGRRFASCGLIFVRLRTHFSAGSEAHRMDQPSTAMLKPFFPTAILVCVFLAGCGGEGPSTVPLKGSVTVDGVPVERGNITFTPLGKNMDEEVSVPIAAGKYEARVPKGKVRVSLQGTKETGTMIEVFGKPEPEVVSVIPRHYSSGIELEPAGCPSAS